MIETTPIPTTPLRDLGPRVPVADPSANDLDKDAFLQLLVAQLRYQDPLNPNDPAEFMATTAQFTVVEKLDELTQQGANTAIISGLSMASSLVGRTVTYVGGDDAVATGVVSSAQVSNGEVRLVTDNGIVDLATVIGIGATDAEPTPADGAEPAATTASVIEPETSSPPSGIAGASEDSPAAAGTGASEPPTSEIPVLSTLPTSPLAVPPLSPTGAEQPTDPTLSEPLTTDTTTDTTTQPPSNTTPASDTLTTKEFTS